MIKLMLFALGVLVLDQAVKLWVLANFALGEARAFIPGVLQLRYVRNTGIAFSFLEGQQWILMVITPLPLIAMVVLLAKRVFSCKVQQFAVAAVLAGGLSNWIDRIVHGAVIDMFEPTFMRFAVFNVADIFITCGAIVFFVAYVIEENRKKKASAETTEEKAGE